MKRSFKSYLLIMLTISLMSMQCSSDDDNNPADNSAEIQKIRGIVEQVKISDEILDYIARLVVKTRYLNTLSLGGSPRASLALMMLCRGRAAAKGRDYVEPDDVKQLFYYVINHRLILTPQAEVDQIPVEQIIQKVIEETPVTL